MALKFSSKLFKNKEIYLKTLSCGAAAQALAKQKSYDDIPGPKSMPFVGNIFNLKQFGKNHTVLFFIEKYLINLSAAILMMKS